jgi:uncharacterized protein RhaS with RHS repeats
VRFVISKPYYRARYYDPAYGRFLSEDPARFGAGPNFYPYTSNKPVNQTDPSGLSGPEVHYQETYVAYLLAGYSPVQAMYGALAVVNVDNPVLSRQPFSTDSCTFPGT